VVAPPLSATVAPLPSDEGARVPEILQSAAATILNEKVRVVAPALAVKVVWAFETAAAVAVKAALDTAAGTFTVAGTLTLELLLAMATLNPPAGDGALKVIVQIAIPGALIVTGVQASPPKVGCVDGPTEIVPPVPAERIPWPPAVDAATAVT
jgi:hypothetical protein